MLLSRYARKTISIRLNKIFQNLLEFDLGISADPKSHLLYSNRAGAYQQLGEYENAEKDGVQCVSLMPQFEKGRLRLADAQLALNKFSEAQQNYQQALVSPDAGIVKLAKTGLSNLQVKV